MTFWKRTGLPFWLPTLLALFALVDAAMRFIPIERLSFRDWEAMTAHRAPDGPFVPNKKYTNRRAYGDLASMGNYPELREYREERFTTDRHGYRNPPSRETDRPIQAIVVGDSYVAGSGVPDNATLTARMEALSRRFVYNAGGEQALHFPDLRRLVERLQMTKGTVLYVHLERKAIPRAEDAQDALYGDAPGDSRGPVAQRIVELWHDAKISRLSILLKRAFNYFRGPINLNRVTLAHLRDGSPMLFFSDEYDSEQNNDRVIDIDYFRELQALCSELHLQLLVVLVPDKLTVYGPLSSDTGPLSPSYLDALDRALREAHIASVNLRVPLMQAAAQRLPHNQLLYWRDDTHWNADGIDLAARQLTRALGWTR